MLPITDPLWPVLRARRQATLHDRRLRAPEPAPRALQGARRLQALRRARLCTQGQQRRQVHRPRRRRPVPHGRLHQDKPRWRPLQGPRRREEVQRARVQRVGHRRRRVSAARHLWLVVSRERLTQEDARRTLTETKSSTREGGYLCKMVYLVRRWLCVCFSIVMRLG